MCIRDSIRSPKITIRKIQDECENINDEIKMQQWIGKIKELDNKGLVDTLKTSLCIKLIND